VGRAARCIKTRRILCDDILYFPSPCRLYYVSGGHNEVTSATSRRRQANDCSTSKHVGDDKWMTKQERRLHCIDSHDQSAIMCTNTAILTKRPKFTTSSCSTLAETCSRVSSVALGRTDNTYLVPGDTALSQTRVELNLCLSAKGWISRAYLTLALLKSLSCKSDRDVAGSSGRAQV
jgi:hypothetical protein